MTKKKKPSFSSCFLNALKDYAPFFIFLALVSNVFVVYRFESTRKPQVVYSVERVFVNTNVNGVVSVPVSNSVSSVASSACSVASSNVVSRTVSTVYYDYFVFQGSRGVRMWDRLYNEGSLTSFGRIEKIFPDRILLEDGGFLVNQKWVGGGVSSRSGSSVASRSHDSSKSDSKPFKGLL